MYKPVNIVYNSCSLLLDVNLNNIKRPNDTGTTSIIRLLMNKLRQIVINNKTILKKVEKEIKYI